jgi:hypothetical protein
VDKHSEYLWFPNFSEDLYQKELDEIFVLFSLLNINKFLDKHYKPGFRTRKWSWGYAYS